jgi:hypothetical protein
VPEIPEYVLVHRARVVRTVRAGAKDEQGERASAPDEGPWFPARRMSPRPSEDPADRGGRRRAEVSYQLLFGTEYEDGSPLTDPPKVSDSVDVEVYGAITRYTVTRPRDLDTGEEIIGGEVDLVEVGDGS